MLKDLTLQRIVLIFISELLNSIKAVTSDTFLTVNDVLDN